MNSHESDTRPVHVVPANPTDQQLKDAFREGLNHSFHRHSVCIYVEFWLDKAKKDRTKVAIRAFSGVLVVVGSQWLVVTAGHCIELVENTIRQGYEFKRCYLFDSMNAVERGVVPFDWASTRPWYEFNEESGADYGALFIGGNTQKLLEAEGKIPMGIGLLEPDETYWFAIYGYPEFASHNTEAQAKMVSYTVIVERTTMPDDLQYVPTVETFFGRKDANTSLSGLSGAPLIACTRDFPWSENSGYYLYAIQAWQRGREMGAPLVRGFLPLLENEIARRKQ